MKDKIKTKIYENGRYEGELFQDARLGYGKFYYNDGSYYEGEWFFDYRSGKGTYIWSNGDKYVGDFLNNKRTGEGIYYFGEGKWKGDRYEGEFLESKKHGYGKYIKDNGKITYGKWEDGKLIKEYENEEEYNNAINPPIIPIFNKAFPSIIKSFYIDEISYKDGAKFYGEVNNNNKPDGVGMLIWKDHSCYVGQFDNGQLHGYGIMFYEHGVIHMGKFAKGNYKGHACYIDEDYASFGLYDHFDQIKEYGWHKNIKVNFNEEELIFKHINNGHYDYYGETKDSKYHGLGVLNGSLSTYIGQFNEGIMCGIGIKIINDTEVYIGQFNHDIYNGYGLYITYDGKVKYGKWENNIYICK